MEIVKPGIEYRLHNFKSKLGTNRPVYREDGCWVQPRHDE